MSKTYTRFVLSTAFLLAFVVALPTIVSAVADIPLHNWIWSSNVGAISVNSADPNAGGGPHSLYIHQEADGSKSLLGWAWSSGVGWIKFGGLSGFPASGSNKFDAKISGSNVIGWARICSMTIKAGDPYLAQMDYPLHVPTALPGYTGDCSTMTSRPDGGDGWVELTGANHSVDYDSATGAITGYAWADAPVGRLAFNLSTTASTDTTANCLLTGEKVGDQNPLTKIQTHRLEWSSSNMLSCSAQNFTAPGVSGSAEVSPVSSTTYYLSCTPISGGAAISCGAYTANVPEPVITPVNPDDPALKMWLDNDTKKLKSTVRVRAGSPVKINWESTTGEEFSMCDAYIDGQLINPEEYDCQNSRNGTPFEKRGLSVGAHTFNLFGQIDFTSPRITAYTSPLSDRPSASTLQIIIYDPTLQEI